MVAEKEVVYQKFPIPLINRLEKHILSTSSMMDRSQMRLARRLDDWAQRFTRLRDTAGPNKEFVYSCVAFNKAKGLMMSLIIAVWL